MRESSDEGFKMLGEKTQSLYCPASGSISAPSSHRASREGVSSGAPLFPASGSGKCVGSLPRGWTLSRLPGLLLLAQLLPALGALRQDVLFLWQRLAQPPPVLILRAAGGGDPPLPTFSSASCISITQPWGAPHYRCGQCRSTGVEWDLGQLPAELVSPGLRLPFIRFP